MASSFTLSSPIRVGLRRIRKLKLRPIFARLGDALTLLGKGPLGILKKVMTWAGRLSAIDKLGAAFKPLEPILPVADAMGVIWGFIAGDSFKVDASTEQWSSFGRVLGEGVAQGVNAVVGGINALIEASLRRLA